MRTLAQFTVVVDFDTAEEVVQALRVLGAVNIVLSSTQEWRQITPTGEKIFLWQVAGQIPVDGGVRDVPA